MSKGEARVAVSAGTFGASESKDRRPTGGSSHSKLESQAGGARGACGSKLLK